MRQIKGPSVIHLFNLRSRPALDLSTPNDINHIRSRLPTPSAHRLFGSLCIPIYVRPSLLSCSFIPLPALLLLASLCLFPLFPPLTLSLLFVCLLSPHPPKLLSVLLTSHLSVRPSIFSSAHSSIHLSICSSILPYIRPIRPFVRLSACVSIQFHLIIHLFSSVFRIRGSRAIGRWRHQRC